MNSPSSVSPTSSTTHLINPNKQKDYASALSTLQDRYGLYGSYTPTFIPDPTSHTAAGTGKALENKTKNKSKFRRSNTSDVNADSDSDTSAGVNGGANNSDKPKRQSRIPKDYENAFAILASSYGVSGHAPVRPTNPKESTNNAPVPKNSVRKSLISWFSRK